MVAVPAATPVTTPVEPTVATEVLLLLHVPPVTVSLKVVVDEVQTVAVPVIEPADEDAPTVTTNVAVELPQAFVPR
jgi:hypothetical protein